MLIVNWAHYLIHLTPSGVGGIGLNSFSVEMFGQNFFIVSGIGYSGQDWSEFLHE